MDFITLEVRDKTVNCSTISLDTSSPQLRIGKLFQVSFRISRPVATHPLLALATPWATCLWTTVSWLLAVAMTTSASRTLLLCWMICTCFYLIRKCGSKLSTLSTLTRWITLETIAWPSLVMEKTTKEFLSLAESATPLDNRRYLASISVLNRVKLKNLRIQPPQKSTTDSKSKYKFHSIK